MAGSIERKFKQVPTYKDPLPRYKFKSPSGPIPVIIIDTNKQIKNDHPNLERITPQKPHAKR